MYLRAGSPSRRPHCTIILPSLHNLKYNILFVGRLVFKRYEKMKREAVAAAVKIQKNIRRYEARKAYKELHRSVLILQSALRAIAAHKELRFGIRTKASVIIQVLADN